MGFGCKPPAWRRKAPGSGPANGPGFSLVQDLVEIADRARHVGLRRISRPVENVAIRAPDPGPRAVDCARPQAGSERAQGADAADAELDAFYRFNGLREYGRAHEDQRSRYRPAQHDGTSSGEVS